MTHIADLTKPNRMPVSGATIVATADLPDRVSNYPGFLAMAHDTREHVPPARAFSTHIVFYQHEQWYASSGHYDMVEVDAMQDFCDRWRMW